MTGRALLTLLCVAGQRALPHGCALALLGGWTMERGVHWVTSGEGQYQTSPATHYAEAHVDTLCTHAQASCQALQGMKKRAHVTARSVYYAPGGQSQRTVRALPSATSRSCTSRLPAWLHAATRPPGATHACRSGGGSARPATAAARAGEPRPRPWADRTARQRAGLSAGSGSKPATAAQGRVVTQRNLSTQRITTPYFPLPSVEQACL